jgi:hypothetical protein
MGGRVEKGRQQTAKAVVGDMGGSRPHATKSMAQRQQCSSKGHRRSIVSYYPYEGGPRRLAWLSLPLVGETKPHELLGS